MHEAMNLVTKKKTSNFSSHFRVEIRRNSKNHNDHNQYDPYNLRIFHKRFHPEDEQTLKFKTTGQNQYHQKSQISTQSIFKAFRNITHKKLASKVRQELTRANLHSFLFISAVCQRQKYITFEDQDEQPARIFVFLQSRSSKLCDVLSFLAWIDYFLHLAPFSRQLIRFEVTNFELIKSRPFVKGN